MVTRKAIVNPSGLVVNVIAITDAEAAKVALGEGVRLIEATQDAEVGGTYDGTRFIRRPPPAPMPDPEWKVEIEALKLRVTALEERK